MQMRIYYRLSDSGNRACNVPWATWGKCLDNFLSIFEDCEITLIADNCSAELLEHIKQLGLRVEQTNLGNSGSFRYALDLFLEESGKSPESFVYFVEDDYIHRLGALAALKEGLRVTDYVTLYDHPDKYYELYGYGELSKVFLTNSCHWKTTCSTCMTFASSYPILEQDSHVWYAHLTGDAPHDHLACLELGRRNRLIASPIPGYATHCRQGYLSPVIDWPSVQSKTSTVRLHSCDVEL